MHDHLSRVDPLAELGGLLLEVEKPARYTGGEFGRLARIDAPLQTLIAFPDLYEIGMSNQALKIIYNRLNGIPGVSCDRAFAPAPDFEKLLRERGIPLYGLDSGISLKSLDLLLVTLGYELGAGSVLTMLDVSGIPLHCGDRSGEDPIVIAGGPAVSNPLPYAAFIDAFWIGEAEAGFFDLAAELAELKKSGQGRAALLARVTANPHVWTAGKAKAVRAIDRDFAGRAGEAAVFPVASMKIVHSHGAVEIMRGCPNGCRFCHAGFWYRPMRQKKSETVMSETAEMVQRGGYREISLSSLSSGDYANIGELIPELNRRFSGLRVSFQLPSLKVSSFSLSLLEQISETRRSGLTFAVETPDEAWQRSLNKTVSADSVAAILREAKKHGWRGAKFYFMIGLPRPLAAENIAEENGEENAIVDFIAGIGRRTGMHFNINVGIFVPKPHTPYQWAAQIESEKAAAKLNYIRAKLKPLGHKVSVSDPLVSLVEGLLSRGDERAGALWEEGGRGGGRLDAWQEYINREQWLAVIEQNRALVDELLGAKEPETPTPWRSIVSGVSDGCMRREREKSEQAECTAPCTEPCADKCGVCGGNTKIISNAGTITHNGIRTEEAPLPANRPDPAIWRMLFSFCKEGNAVFHGHLGMIEIFSMAFIRAALDVLYSQGFNPLAKLEIVAPLSTGISAAAEIASIDFAEKTAPADFTEKLNRSLPEGIRIIRAEGFTIPAGRKKHSLSSLLWGFGYDGQNGPDYVPAAGEKSYRQKTLVQGASVFSLKRNSVLAKNIITPTACPETEWASYFDVYRFLYG